MSFLSALFVKSRVKSASRRLAADPSARNYVALAQEYARLGRVRDVMRICQEGVETYPGSIELKRLMERSSEVQREGRLRELQNELRHSPRPALWREFCELLLSAGRFQRAEEVAAEWQAKTRDGEAVYWRARSRSEGFFTDRRVEDGRIAFRLTAEAIEASPDERRPLELRLELCARIGVWREARRALARLLELSPGEPELEARFREVMTLSEKSRSIDEALRDVEMSGEFVDDKPRRTRVSKTVAVRPILQGIAEQPSVQAALYVRGGTALVQGPRGVQAERSARALREVLQTTRAASRRLGLGSAQEIELEGEFGFLHCVVGDVGSAAVWSKRPVNRGQLAQCRELAGMVDAEAAA